MNLPPSFLLITKFDLETSLVILSLILIIVSGWLAYRNRTLTAGISALNESLKSNSTSSKEQLPKASRQACLAHLTRTVRDTVAEADMQKGLAVGVQQIQNVLIDQVADALFVVDKNQETAIRQIVEELKQRDWNDYL